MFETEKHIFFFSETLGVTGVYVHLAAGKLNTYRCLWLQVDPGQTGSQS
jgi:hypothetical protein